MTLVVHDLVLDAKVYGRRVGRQLVQPAASVLEGNPEGEIQVEMENNLPQEKLLQRNRPPPIDWKAER